jgi:hypothetical protein
MSSGSHERKGQLSSKSCKMSSKSWNRMTDFLPLERINPPKSITTKTANDPKTYATIMFLAAPAMNRKREAAI